MWSSMKGGDGRFRGLECKGGNEDDEGGQCAVQQAGNRQKGLDLGAMPKRNYLGKQANANVAL